MTGEAFISVFSITLNCIVFAYFLFAPFRTRFRYSYFVTAMLAAFLIVVTVLISVLFFTHDKFLVRYSTFGILLWLFCALFTFHFAIKGSYFEILFIVLVVLNLYVNIAAVAKVIMIVSNFNIADVLTYGLFRTVVLIACLPPFWVLFGKLYQQVIEANMNFPFWRFIWAVPALLYMIFFVKIIPEYWKNPIAAGNADILFVLLWAVTTYAVFCVTLLMLIQSYEGVTAKQQTELITAQLKMQESQYERLLENIENTARLRHDWRHHLLAINSLVETRQTEALLNYLKELTPTYTSGEESSVCQNHIVDVILQHYAAIAREHDIALTIAADIPKALTIADTDLCVIFGNLVENAVEACTWQSHGDKRIEIKAETKGRQLALIIKNTYQQSVVHRGETYYSTKHDGAGIGLSSVGRVAKKNHGKMKISYNETQFKVYVLFDIYC